MLNKIGLASHSLILLITTATYFKLSKTSPKLKFYGEIFYKGWGQDAQSGYSLAGESGKGNQETLEPASPDAESLSAGPEKACPRPGATLSFQQSLSQAASTNTSNTQRGPPHHASLFFFPPMTYLFGIVKMLGEDS